MEVLLLQLRIVCWSTWTLVWLAGLALGAAAASAQTLQSGETTLGFDATILSNLGISGTPSCLLSAASPC